MRRSAVAAGALALLLPIASAGMAGAQPRDAVGGAAVTEGSAQDIEIANDQRLRAAERRARLAERGRQRHDDQHGGPEDHLPGSSENIKLVGRLDLTDKPGEIADVTGDPRRGFAYLSARGVGNADCPTGGGFYIADIRNASKPKKVGFIQYPEHLFPGEGAHAVRIKTRFFNGVILAGNNEPCGTAPAGINAGLSLYDVTKPTRPSTLAENFGDTEFRGTEQGFVHDYHSVFIWQQGDRAFAMGTDNDEPGGYDVDIFEITDPRNPVKISETGLPDWPEALEDVNRANGIQPLVHDFQIKNVRGTWIGLLSYWDAGYVLVNLDDPANPEFINNTDWSSPDPEFPQFERPEGNAHQAWFSPDNRFIIGTDEDFSPYRTTLEITSGPNVGQYQGGEFGWTVPIVNLPDGQLNGPVTYGGYACPGSPETIPAPPTDLQPGEEAILVVQRGPVNDPNATYPACFFSEKVEAGEKAGYDAVVVANHHAGSAGGAFPDAAICGSRGHQYTPQVHGGCMGHRTLHLLFNRTPDYTLPYPQGDPGDLEPNVGDRGERITMSPEFDGWGYAHLYDARTLREIDTFAIDEAKSEDFAQGFGALSVHEVQFQPGERRNIAWFSWYSGGVRVVKYGYNGMREVGHYIHEEGNDFWGIDFGRDAAGRSYALASDRDDGLWIFAYTGG